MQMTRLAKPFLEHGQGKLKKGKEKPFLGAALVIFALPTVQGPE